LIALLDENQIENASSWFVTDAYGTQIAAAFEDDTAAKHGRAQLQLADVFSR
jgi:hypothetical protein